MGWKEKVGGCLVGIIHPLSGVRRLGRAQFLPPLRPRDEGVRLLPELLRVLPPLRKLPEERVLPPLRKLPEERVELLERFQPLEERERVFELLRFQPLLLLRVRVLGR
ncbi:MAG: hypothetical protein D6765_09045 [Bacteroidetes bacterium]|nr:MAG: hypothetical protein D6765_09045 [Bacteroidota bacterium]